MKKDFTIFDVYCSLMYVANVAMGFFVMNHEDVTMGVMIMAVSMSSLVRTIMYHVVGDLKLLDVALFLFWVATALIGVAVMIDGGECFGLGVMVMGLSVLSVIRMGMYYVEK